jgi:hypothetical protein
VTNTRQGAYSSDILSYPSSYCIHLLQFGTILHLSGYGVPWGLLFFRRRQ